MILLGTDSETTGLDIYHGAKPYFVSLCDGEDNQTWYEWDVDPTTRQPLIPPEDIGEINERIESADRLVLHNAKFDFAAFRSIGIGPWDWDKVRDTILGSHLLHSNYEHTLDACVLRFLGVSIARYEVALQKACESARTMVRNNRDKFPGWRLAKKGEPDMPSLHNSKSKPWKQDAWLPRAIAKHLNYPPEHPWWTVLADYGNGDTAVLIPLYQEMERLVEERKLGKIFAIRHKVLPIAAEMENHGVTLSQDRVEGQIKKFSELSKECEERCVKIARSYGYELTLPKSGNNKSLLNFFFSEEGMNLEPAGYTDTGGPSLDKKAIEHYQATLPERSKPRVFVEALRSKRKADTAVSYLEGYKRFWLPVHVAGGDGARLVEDDPGRWYVLHPSLNPTGTDTLRWSSSSPNEQNISKQDDFNLRYCFGPPPGREWWSCDAKNIEARLPAYEAKEQLLIDLYERPDDPPYFGSYHYLAFDTLHPEKYAEHGPKVKKVYGATWYQWTKNGNFAVQYGAVEESGTADAAYHIPGAQRKIQERLGKINDLNREQIEKAERLGYVETIIDKSVDPERGYPLLCTVTRWGKIKPTVPLNYHIQGTAMWWMMMAMIRCQEYLDELNRRAGRKLYFIAMQVHDELVFDFPYVKNKGNLPKVRKLMKLMEKGGEGIGIPTPVSCEYHDSSWSEGVSA